MLSGFDRKDQELFLANSLEEMDNLKDAIDLITEAWSDGDHVVFDLAAVADFEVRQNTVSSTGRSTLIEISE